jgi:hypothetical protein
VAGGPLPANFAQMLAEVLEPGSEAAAASIVAAASALDDDALRCFLDRVADDVRRLGRRLSSDDLRVALERCR